MSPVAGNPVIVPYRYLEDENNPGNPTHPLPVVRLVAPQRKPMVVCLRARLEHLRYRRVCPTCLYRLQPSASSVAGGRRSRTGMSTDNPICSSIYLSSVTSFPR
jgi:hypothetical protein